MPTTSGRNSKLENLWRSVTGFVGKVFNIETGQTSPTVGQTVASFESHYNRRYDQEYYEIPIRDVVRARRLIDLRNVPEIGTAIDTLVGDVFSSEDGDDIGVTVASTLPDGSDLDPAIYQICVDVVDRVLRGTELWTTVEEFLLYGDSFRSIVLSSDYKRIERLKQLPTWEMFRVEDFNGNLLRYEQRRTINAAEYEIHPIVCVHWRHRRRFKYGRSLFEETLGDIESLNTAYYALEKGTLATAVNPNIHVMPEGWSLEQKKSYQQTYEREKEQGKIVTDFYTNFGGDVKKLGGGWNPDITALIDNVLQRRSRIAMRSRLPAWLLGLPTQGARDISGQPALAYARLIGSIRMVLTEGIRHIIDLELALNGYSDIKYRIIYPKIYTTTQAQSTTTTPMEESEVAPGIEDLDRALNKYKTFSIR